MARGNPTIVFITFLAVGLSLAASGCITAGDSGDLKVVITSTNLLQDISYVLYIDGNYAASGITGIHNAGYYTQTFHFEGQTRLVHLHLVATETGLFGSVTEYDKTAVIAKGTTTEVNFLV